MLWDIAHFDYCFFSNHAYLAVLKGVGQTSLAYLTAATHGYEEEAAALKSELESKGQPIPPIDPNARLLVPLPPVCKVRNASFSSFQYSSSSILYSGPTTRGSVCLLKLIQLEDNWPLLSTARGPFDLLGLVPPSKAPGAGVSQKPAAAAFAVADDLDVRVALRSTFSHEKTMHSVISFFFRWKKEELGVKREITSWARTARLR